MPVRKKLRSILTILVTALTMTALCVSIKAGDYPKLDLNPTEALGVSPEGVKAVAPSAFSLTDDELKRLKEGNFTAAWSYHELDNMHNLTKLRATRTLLESWGVKVLSVANAKFKAEAQMSDIESIMALNPDVLFVMPVDPDTAAAALNQSVKGTKTKVVFMENVATGFKPGVDYAGQVSSDSYGNGKTAADILAHQLNFKGKVAMMFYDMAFFVTNERDRAFRETMAKYYPDIEIVMEAGFSDVNNTTTVADAIFARHPDIDGIFATWDIPAEGAIASAKSVGRNDIIITCCDLDDNTARMIAEDGMIRGTGAARSYEQGEGEAWVAAYALLGKTPPSTFVTPPALPVVKENVLEAFRQIYRLEPPQALLDVVARNKNK